MNTEIDSKFPSPFGVVYFLIKADEIELEQILEFPSPFGVVYFLILLKLMTNKQIKYVSVSFRSCVFSY